MDVGGGMKNPFKTPFIDKTVKNFNAIANETMYQIGAIDAEDRYKNKKAAIDARVAATKQAEADAEIKKQADAADALEQQQLDQAADLRRRNRPTSSFAASRLGMDLSDVSAARTLGGYL